MIDCFLFFVERENPYQGEKTSDKHRPNNDGHPELNTSVVGGFEPRIRAIEGTFVYYQTRPELRSDQWPHASLTFTPLELREIVGLNMNTHLRHVIQPAVAFVITLTKPVQ